MNAVFDTSPISYLLLIGQIELLPVLYSRISIPSAVAVELGHRRAPSVVKGWIASPPGWLEVHPVRPQPAWDLDSLEIGEREAILLAGDLGADQVVLDDLASRVVAARRGLAVTGLIGILDQAATRSLIDLSAVVERLQETNFHVAPDLLKNLLDRHVP